MLRRSGARGEPERDQGAVAVAAAPLLLLQLLLLARIGVAIGAWLTRRRPLRSWVRVAAAEESPVAP